MYTFVARMKGNKRIFANKDISTARGVGSVAENCHMRVLASGNSSRLIKMPLLLLSFLSILSFGYLNAQAATTYYVRAGATGASNGSDWNNAYTSLPASLQRGATYYVADGSYGGYTFNDATSGSTYITLRKATASDHGTGTGWSSAYGDGQAEFTGQIRFDDGYYTIDGQVGGGPGSWFSGYGFLFSTASANQIFIAGGVTNITLRHIDVEGISRTSQVGQWGVYAVSGGSDITLSYCRFYNQQKVNIAFYAVDNVVIEYCKIGPNGKSGTTYAGGGAMHKIGLSLRNNETLTVRYNLFEDISETSYIGIVNDAAGELASDWDIHGNIFFETRTLSGTGCAYIVGISRSLTTLSNFKFYNNVVANMSAMSNAGIRTIAINGGGNEAKNNIWYNNVTNALDIQVKHDYNYFNNNKHPDGYDRNVTEPNGQIDTGDPFTAMSSRNFSLVEATDAGVTLSSNYKVGILGNTRGVDGTWDRGAYEFTGEGSPTPPNGDAVPKPPTGLHIVSP